MTNFGWSFQGLWYRDWSSTNPWSILYWLHSNSGIVLLLRIFRTHFDNIKNDTEDMLDYNGLYRVCSRVIAHPQLCATSEPVGLHHRCSLHCSWMIHQYMTNIFITSTSTLAPGQEFTDKVLLNYSSWYMSPRLFLTDFTVKHS